MTIFDYIQVVDTSSSRFCQPRRLLLPAGSGTKNPSYTAFSMTVPRVFCRISRILAKPNR